jgi:hypothetical protein
MEENGGGVLLSLWGRCFWLLRKKRSEIALDGGENVDLKERELCRFDAIRRCVACIKRKRGARFAAFGAYLAAIAMVHIMPQIGPELINVNERYWQISVESVARPLPEKKIEIVDERTIGVAVCNGLVQPAKGLGGLVGSLEQIITGRGSMLLV